MRVFIAVPSPAEIRSKIAAVGARLEACGKIKAVEEENIHFTLKFIGEVNPGNIDKIKDALSQVSAESSFTLSVRGIGVFPKPSFPRVIWAGAKEGADELTRLHEKTDTLLAPLGFKPENRFHPHATIARVRHLSDADKLAQILSENKDKEYGTYKVSSLNLMESRLSPTGPEYRLLHEIKLG
ncbi:MAG: RNA 2',3'-cyclic phosphodiesterase [Candidatus Altiarchaeota archaeon]